MVRTVAIAVHAVLCVLQADKGEELLNSARDELQGECEGVKCV